MKDLPKISPFLLTGILLCGLGDGASLSAQIHEEEVQAGDAALQAPSDLAYYPLDSNSDMAYPKPRPFQFIVQSPDDLWQLAKSPFRRENLTGLLAVGATTFTFMIMDQPLADAVQHFGSAHGISGRESNHILWGIRDGQKTVKLLSVPGNVNTALYQLGEGFPSLLLGGGLWVYGKINHDDRSLSTASQLAETFVVMGVSTQVLKRMAGRQTPGHATVPGGLWRPFPSFKAFQHQTPEYDAFPSGHLATLMSTVTILADNYPEKKYIKPVGYSLIGLVSLAMVNNGVHWFGDYPLAIALGYVSARIVSAKYHHPEKRRQAWYLPGGEQTAAEGYTERFTATKR